MLKQKGCNMVIFYCTVVGLISAWAISGLLVIVDIVSNTPAGTFFSVIGVSIGIEDPVVALYIGFGLHVLTGTAAGNIFGQGTSIWNKVFSNWHQTRDTVWSNSGNSIIYYNVRSFSYSGNTSQT